MSSRGSLLGPPVLETWERAKDTMVELAWEMPLERRFSVAAEEGGTEMIKLLPIDSQTFSPMKRGWYLRDVEKRIKRSEENWSKSTLWIICSPCTTSVWRWSRGRPTLAISLSVSGCGLSPVLEYVRFPAWTCRSCSKSLSAAVKSQFLPNDRKYERICLRHQMRRLLYKWHPEGVKSKTVLCHQAVLSIRQIAGLTAQTSSVAHR